MSNHTPGPWHHGVDNPKLVWSGCKIESRIVAHCADDQYPINDLEQEANARLIAAAPELLEALKGVVRVADRATVEFDAARAAIAKAAPQTASVRSGE